MSLERKNGLSRHFIFTIQSSLHYPQPQLIQLPLICRARRIDHHIAPHVVFREGDKVADRVGAVHYGGQVVEAKGNTPVRRGAVFKSAEQEAELRFGLFGREAC